MLGFVFSILSGIPIKLHQDITPYFLQYFKAYEQIRQIELTAIMAASRILASRNLKRSAIANRKSAI